MRMSPEIILSGQNPNFLQTMGQAAQVAGATNAVQDQNALRGLYREQGPGIMAGDQNAMNALARLDPAQAAQFQQNREQSQMARERLSMARQAAARAAETHVAQMDAVTRQKEAEDLDRTLSRLAMANDPQSWDAFAQEVMPEAVGQFEQRDMILAQGLGLKDVLAMQAPKGPQSSVGKVQADIDAGLLPKGTPLYKPGVTVSTGDSYDPRPMTDKPPKGYQRRYDEERRTWVDEPIPGGEASREVETADKASQVAAANYKRKFDIVDSKIDEAVASIDQNGRLVAGYGSFLSGLPESAAREFQATVDTIKANLGFEELQAMRDSSPTGGALGAISEREIAFLQAIQGNLDTAQSPAQLKKILTDIKQRRAEFQAEREAILSGKGKASPDGMDFSGMALEDLTRVDVTQMDADTLDRFMSRMREVQGQ